MKKILILFGIILCMALNAQTPWITGSNSGDGELKERFIYLNSRSDSITSFIDPSDSTARLIVLTVDTLLYVPPHGAMNLADSSHVIALTQNEWAKVTNATNTLFTIQEQSSMIIAGDSITIGVKGDYSILWSLSFTGTSNDVFHISIFKNGIKESVAMSRSTSNNDIGNMGLPAYIEGLDIGDNLSFMIRNTGDDDDATIKSSSVIIQLIHNE